MLARALLIARAVARLAPQHERDDATSEALLAIVLAATRFDATRGAWSTWAEQHARRAVVRYVVSRAGCVRRPVVDRLGAAAPLQIEDIDRLADEADVEMVERLARAAAAEPDLVPLRLAGFSQREVGERLGCSKSQIARRERLVLSDLEATS